MKNVFLNPSLSNINLDKCRTNNTSGVNPFVTNDGLKLSLPSKSQKCNNTKLINNQMNRLKLCI